VIVTAYKDIVTYFTFMLPCIVIDVSCPSDSAWKRSSKNLHETYQCRMYSRELLMTGREDARNM